MTKHRISISAIKSIVKSSPSSSKEFVWDTEVRGFGVYRTADGSAVFVYQYRMAGGTTQRITIGQLGEFTVEQARTQASTLAYERRTGTDPIAARKERERLAEAETGMVISSYFKAYSQRRRIGDPMSATQVNVFRRDLLAYLGDKRLDRLTTDDVDRFKEELHARGPSMVRSGLVCLTTLINDAVWRGTLKRTAAHAIEVSKTMIHERRLDAWEGIHVYEAGHDIGDVRGDIIEVLLRMGKRKEEVAEMPWSEIDLDKRQWRLPGNRNKSKRPHLILLPHQVCSIIERQQPDPSKRTGPVFTLNGTTPTEMGSQVKDLIDANLHRRIELAADQGRIARGSSTIPCTTCARCPLPSSPRRRSSLAATSSTPCCSIPTVTRSAGSTS